MSTATSPLPSPARSARAERLEDQHREYQEFEVETDRAGEPPVPFWSETVRVVVVAVVSGGDWRSSCSNTINSRVTKPSLDECVVS